jgi:hypothetical protein
LDIRELVSEYVAAGPDRRRCWGQACGSGWSVPGGTASPGNEVATNLPANRRLLAW